jgi:hypothetical protein
VKPFATLSIGTEAIRESISPRWLRCIGSNVIVLILIRGCGCLLHYRIQIHAVTYSALSIGNYVSGGDDQPWWL